MPQTTPPSEKPITLNIAPVTFSSGTITIGKIEYENEEEYAKLRNFHWQTHAFRFDSRDGFISNVAIVPGTDPIGRAETVNAQENLLLMGRAIQQSIVN